MADAPPRGVWVHVFEEDTAAGAVFRPENADIPLSRRPRERVEFRSGGAATIWKGGPDDRPAPIAAQWTDEADHLIVRDSGGIVRLKVIEQWPDRLLVRLSL